VSVENCVSFLDPLIESWDIDLLTFAMEIVLNRRLAPGDPKRFEFVEKEAEEPSEGEPGLKEFLRDPSLSGDATEEEIEFLERLRLRGKRPTPLYYYRELQNLRDPLNFSDASVAPLHKYGNANAVGKQMQIHAREGAIQRWAGNKADRSPKRRKSKAVR
jgi:hypothetical protein